MTDNPTDTQIDPICRLRALIDGTVLKMVERDPNVAEHVVVSTVTRRLEPGPSVDADVLLKNMVECVARAQYFERALRRVLKDDLIPSDAKFYTDWADFKIS